MKFSYKLINHQPFQKEMAKNAVHIIGNLLYILEFMPELFKQALHKLQQGIFNQSICLFEKALAEAKSGNKKINRHQILLHMSAAHLELGNHEVSKQISSEIIKENNQLEQAHINLIISMALLGEYNKSLTLCEQRINLNSKYWKLYSCKAYVLSLIGNYQEASANYSISITKNQLNDPKSYILQAACLANIDELDAAMKSMHYAQLAMRDDEKKNCHQHYQFEIANIKLALKYFQAYSKKINEAQVECCITDKQKQTYLKKLLKIVGKSVNYGSLSFKYWNNGEPKQIQMLSDNVSEINSISARSQRADVALIWSEVNILEEGLSMKKKASRRLKTKVSLNSETDSKKQGENKIVCEWLRSKCSIF